MPIEETKAGGAMAFQTVFHRYELKYLLNYEQKQRILQAMEGRMEPDRHGRSTVRNIYYDTERFLLIRRSLEKPVYKEKRRGLAINCRGKSLAIARGL